MDGNYSSLDDSRWLYTKLRYYTESFRCDGDDYMQMGLDLKVTEPVEDKLISKFLSGGIISIWNQWKCL